MCVEDPQDRASVAYQLHQMLEEGKQTTAKSPELLGNVKALAWTRSDIPYKAPEAGVKPEDLSWADPRYILRLQGGLFFQVSGRRFASRELAAGSRVSTGTPSCSTSESSPARLEHGSQEAAPSQRKFLASMQASTSQAEHRCAMASSLVLPG